MNGHVVRLAKSGGWEGCLAREAFEAVAIGGAVVSGAVGARVWKRGSGGLSSRGGSADVECFAHLRWTLGSLAIVLVVGVMGYLG